MIENLRKYPGVITAALILVGVGFLFMDTQNFFRSASNRFITVDDISYSESEFRRLGPNTMGVMMNAGDSGYQALIALSGDQNAPESEQSSPERTFFVNRMLLRKSGKELGVVPSQKEIEQFIREKTYFAQPDPTEQGKKNFNQELYDNFIKTRLGSLSLSERDFLEVVKDVMTYEKINEVMKKSVEASSSASRQKILADNQKIDLQFIEYKLTDYELKQNPTEEEIKAFWEIKKDAYKTDARRRFSYVLIKPTYEPGTETAPEPPKPVNPREPAPEPSVADKDIIKKRKSAQIAAADRINDFLDLIADKKDPNFEALVKEQAFGELKRTDFFHESSIPDEMLKIQFRPTEQKNMSKFLFGSKITSDPLSTILTVTTIDNEQLLVKIDAEEPVRVKTYQEAKTNTKLDLIKENATKQMKEVAETARKNLADAIASGKSFADAAKEATLTATSIKALTKDGASATQPHATALFAAARLTNPATFSEKTVNSKDNELIVFVEKREIVIDPTREALINQDLDTKQQTIDLQLFRAWLKQQRSNIEVK